MHIKSLMEKSKLKLVKIKFLNQLLNTTSPYLFANKNDRSLLKNLNVLGQLDLKVVIVTVIVC